MRSADITPALLTWEEVPNCCGKIEDPLIVDMPQISVEGDKVIG